jgi:carbamoyl-phosphate synthase small subunit
MMNDITAVLVLQNGQIYEGQGFGTQGIRYGECVFTTGMTGYTESLTDPSYAGQILCFASPLIGNIGTSQDWYESDNMYANGVVVSSQSEQGFHSESNNSLEEFLKTNNRGGIQNIDTRRLVKTLRDEGNQPCILIVGQERIKMLKVVGFDLTKNIDTKTFDDLVQMIDNPEDVGFLDWAGRVSKDRNFSEKLKVKSEKLDINNSISDFGSNIIPLVRGGSEADGVLKNDELQNPPDRILNQVQVKPFETKKPQSLRDSPLSRGNKTIVVLDCGVKLNILRELAKRVKKLIVLPADTTCNEIMKYNPDGVLLSNGPGDPRDYDYAVQTVKDLLTQNIPIMGICLGHQLLSLAIGCEVYKMKFGNRGANQPVQDLTTNKAYLTSQNHGYATKPDTIPKDYQIFFQNLNDQTVEGIIHKTLPIFSVQFHPEACGGPQDTNWLFDKFINSL